jgi:hypothetical protein
MDVLGAVEDVVMTIAVDVVEVATAAIGVNKEYKYGNMFFL